MISSLRRASCRWRLSNRRSSLASLGVAVFSYRQNDNHIGVAVRLDRDLPAQVASFCDPLGPRHRSPVLRERVVPEGLVAQLELLTELQLEGERVLSVMGLRRVVDAGSQRRRRRGVVRHTPAGEGRRRVAHLVPQPVCRFACGSRVAHRHRVLR